MDNNYYTDNSNDRPYKISKFKINNINSRGTFFLSGETYLAAPRTSGGFAAVRHTVFQTYHAIFSSLNTGRFAGNFDFENFKRRRCYIA